MPQNKTLRSCTFVRQLARDAHAPLFVTHAVYPCRACGSLELNVDVSVQDVSEERVDRGITGVDDQDATGIRSAERDDRPRELNPNCERDAAFVIVLVVPVAITVILRMSYAFAVAFVRIISRAGAVVDVQANAARLDRSTGRENPIRADGKTEAAARVRC